jgi:hypothetical protein
MSSLLNFQLLQENAPPCLTVAHFDEFADDKSQNKIIYTVVNVLNIYIY